VADAHTHVDALLQKIGDSVEEQQATAHAGVALHEGGHRGCHVHLPEQHRRRHREQAGGITRLVAQGRLRLTQRSQQIAAAFQIVAPLAGQGDAAGGAVEKTHPQLCLQGRQGAHHRRQGGPAGAGGSTQAARFGNLHEGRHCLQLVHGHYSTKRISQIHVPAFIRIAD
jgi:hypothetical protein